MPDNPLELIRFRNLPMRVTGYEDIAKARKPRGGKGGQKNAVDFGATPAALIFANIKGLDLDGSRVVWPEKDHQKREEVFRYNVH